MSPAHSVHPDHTRRVCLGTIATAHGVRGLVKVKCEADDPQMLNGQMYLSQSGEKTLQLKMKNSMGKYWLAEIDGVSDRDAALAYRGTKLWVDRESLPQIDDEDEFYIEDLNGLSVITKDGADGGKVIAVENFGAGDLLEIKPNSSQSYYLAFTKANVPKIDLKNSQITICVPEDE